MKQKKQRPGWRRPKRETPGLRALTAQPEKDFYRLPAMELRPKSLLADGCRRVLEYTPQKLCLDMGQTIVTLYGAELRIESLAGKRVIVTGKLARMEFAQKWEA